MEADGIKLLLSRLDSENEGVRAEALKQLRTLDGEASFVVMRLLESNDKFERMLGARGVGELKLESAVMRLLVLLDDLDCRVCAEAERALAKLGVEPGMVKTAKKIAREFPIRQAEDMVKKELAKPVVDLENVRVAVAAVMRARARRQPEYRIMLPKAALKA